MRVITVVFRGVIVHPELMTGNIEKAHQDEFSVRKKTIEGKDKKRDWVTNCV
jgi:hypothetical protein